MALPNIINSRAPEAPRKMSYSFSTTISKKEARKLRLLKNPLTRPERVSPRKKVAWRLVRKWFNRYEKPLAIGATVIIGQKAGQQIPIQARITDVRIRKEGGHRRSYEYTLTPSR